MPNDAPEPDELAHSLLGLTEQLRDRAEEDPFGNPVLSVALAITRQFDSGRPGRGGRYRADTPIARRRLRRPRGAHRGLCRWRRHGGERACPRLARAASAAPRSERQPGALGHVPRAGGPHPVRRRVHGTPDLRAAQGREPGAGRGRERTSRTGVRKPPAAADHAEGRIRPAAFAIHNGRDATRPLRRGPADRRPRRMARPLDRTRAAADHPVHLGRLRHRWAHRYRLVGHAAPATGNEAAATRVGCTTR